MTGGKDDTGDAEKINLVTIESWFANINEKLKFKCFKELATVRFSPSLNLKSSRDVIRDTEKLHQAAATSGKKNKGQSADIGSYYLNIAEELNDFDEWCISERGVWGIPIPYFTRKDTQEVLYDAEIARHVAAVFRKHGGSDAWYKLSVEELLPPRYKADAVHLVKGDQIFDVWFDNSLTWDFGLIKDAHSLNEVTHHMNQGMKSLGIDTIGSERHLEGKSSGGRKGIKALSSRRKQPERPGSTATGLTLQQLAI